MSSLLIQNGQIVTEDGVHTSDILIEDGIIKTITQGNLPTFQPSNHQTIDAANLLIFPGLIDCHVHFREPGNTEAEDMMSGASAARNGGVTTVCDMPNTNPPTSSVIALKDKLERAKRVTDCDIRFFFNVSTEADLEELEQVHRNDICGVKLYFDHSTGNLGADKKAIEGAFAHCAKNNIPVVCHCEDPEINAQAKENVMKELSSLGSARDDILDISAHSDMRPPESEMEAVDEAIALARKFGTKLHIAHLSTSFGLDLVRKAKADGLPITCEVAPHHLFLSVDDYAHLGTLAKMNPPLRTKDHCDALMQGVLDGSVDCIATDHAPHTLESKQSTERDPSVMLSPDEARPRIERRALLAAPSGVPGVETMLPLLLNANIPPQKILSLCFTLPNRIFSLGKAGIAVGKPADIILVNPKQSWTIHGKDLHSKCGWTPYEGWEVKGKVIRVI